MVEGDRRSRFPVLHLPQHRMEVNHDQPAVALVQRQHSGFGSKVSLLSQHSNKRVVSDLRAVQLYDLGRRQQPRVRLPLQPPLQKNLTARD